MSNNIRKYQSVAPLGGSYSSTSSYSYRRDNEKLLLKLIKEQFGITEEDMESPSVVKSKIRDSNINNILEYKI